MISITIEIPDEVAMELNAHIAMFRSKLHIEVHVTEMVLSAITGYLIEHSNDILDYRIAHEPTKRATRVDVSSMEYARTLKP